MIVDRKRKSSSGSSSSLSALSNMLRQSLSIKNKGSRTNIYIQVEGDADECESLPITRQPSESITGNIVVESFTSESIEVEEISVCFEGALRSFIQQEGANDPLYTSSNSVVIHKFLKQLHLLDVSKPSRSPSPPQSPRSVSSTSSSEFSVSSEEYPYFFIVPPKVIDTAHIYNGADHSEPVHHLPPTMKTSMRTGRNALEIKYQLRAKMRYHTRFTDADGSVQLGPEQSTTTTRVVKMIPIADDISPPVTLEHHPDEFKLIDTTQAGGEYQVACAAVKDLQPLNFANADADGILHGECKVKLQCFSSKDKGVSTITPDDLAAAYIPEFSQYLHTMTFHTIKPTTSTHTLKSSWTDPNISFLHSRDPLEIADVGKRLEWSTVTKTTNGGSTPSLESTLTIPIAVPVKEGLCTSFRTPYAERRHAIELKVELKRNKGLGKIGSKLKPVKLRLRLPLQILNMPQGTPGAAESPVNIARDIGVGDDEPPEYVKDWL